MAIARVHGAPGILRLVSALIRLDIQAGYRRLDVLNVDVLIGKMGMVDPRP